MKPDWHREEYPSITIETLWNGQKVSEWRKNELLEWAYHELRLVTSESELLNRRDAMQLEMLETLSSEGSALRSGLEMIISSFGSCAEIGYCPNLGYPVEDWCPYCIAKKAISTVSESHREPE